jgi:hypothetical protein
MTEGISIVEAKNGTEIRPNSEITATYEFLSNTAFVPDAMTMSTTEDVTDTNTTDSADLILDTTATPDTIAISDAEITSTTPEIMPCNEDTTDSEINPDNAVKPDTEAMAEPENMPAMEISPETVSTSDSEDMPDAEVPPQPRSLVDIKEEFRMHNDKSSKSLYRMGQLLIEAKDTSTDKGEWLKWLSDVNFQKRRAQRLMQIAKGYPNASTLTLLGQSKALVLLRVPADERDDFIDEEHIVLVSGSPMSVNVRQMKVKELADAIRQRYGRKKESSPKLPPQSLPLMPHQDELEEAEAASELNRQFSNIHLFINSLMDHSDNLDDGSEMRDELTDKLQELKELIEEAVEHIAMLRED